MRERTGDPAGNQSATDSATENPDVGTLTRVWRGISKPVFIPSSIIIVGLILFAASSAQDSQRIFGNINSFVTESIGWWYILIVTLFVVFAFYVALSKIGNIRLGADDDRPEFSTGAWFAMLFSAGMGIGLVFWGVAEPLNHLINPPSISGEVAEGIAAADQAMSLTFFHWGLHAWAIYVVIGLGLAYMTFRRGRPLSLRWLLEPLLGRERVEGWIGHIVDVVAVVGTLFGVATSLGLGVQQILAGLVSLGWIESSSNAAIVIAITGITAIATLSVVSGVYKGLKWLSNINMGLAAGLMTFVLLAGPTLFLLNAWIHNLGGYFAALPEYMLRMAPLDTAAGDTWLSGWTIFYWGWWMSWAPFVGMFIARISKGRTIREFVLGVLLAPTLLSTLWFTVFGESGILRQLQDGDMLVDGAVDTNTSLFILLDGLPLASLTSLIAIIVVALFFITSSDSGSLVIDMLANGGRTNTPTITRVYWAILEGLAAAVLLIAGGSAALLALQTASIVTAVPISIVLVIACVSLLRALRYEVSTTARYLRIVGGSSDLPIDVPAEGEADSVPTAAAGSNGEEPELVVAVHQLNPASVEVDPETGNVHLVEEPYGADPLAGLVGAEQFRDHGSNGDRGADGERAQ
jgi:choline/glycine/proline betaine transport protein